MRCNEQIRLSPVRLVDGDGNQRGVMPTDEAMALAREAGVDLVEVSPNERPPVCKIMDYGKHKYLQSKKQKQKHHEQRLKEIRIRPKTDPHDKEIKLDRARRFLDAGDRVQFTMMFRGRERFHKEVGLEIFDEIVASLEEVAKLERRARTMGRRMTMVLVPIKPGSPKKAKPAKEPSATTASGVAARTEPGPQPAGGAEAGAGEPASSAAGRPVVPRKAARAGDGSAG